MLFLISKYDEKVTVNIAEQVSFLQNGMSMEHMLKNGRTVS